MPAPQIKLAFTDRCSCYLPANCLTRTELRAHKPALITTSKQEKVFVVLLVMVMRCFRCPGFFVGRVCETCHDSTQ